MANKIQIKWHGAKVQRRIEAIMYKRLDQAAELVKAQTIRNLRAKPTWPAGRGNLPYTPSKPGEIPHVDRGRLSQSIVWDRAGRMTRRIGTPLKYGLYLQVGTRRVKKRPYMDVTLKENTSKVKAIITAPITK